jgi:glycosyltransferase involved in cell wall biosynthesis
MNSTPGAIDVFIPCYGYGHYLRECVESVLTHTTPRIRVLIIDDASPDGTPDVATDLTKEDSRVTYFRHATNRGHIATYNEGIEWASADYMLLLSADDYLLPGALTRVSELMDAHPEVGFTFGKAVELTEGGTFCKTQTFVNTTISTILGNTAWSVLSGPDFFGLIDSAGSRNIVPTPTAVVRTELQKRAGGYRQELPHSGDLEMWLRLAAHGSVAVLGTYQAVTRLHGSNMQNSYYHRKSLADLRQRKAAFDCVFDTCRAALPHDTYEKIRRGMLRNLGLEAVRNASFAFNENDFDLSDELAGFASSAHPGIRTTLPWRLLQCKRLMGTRVSHLLLPAVARLRQLRLPQAFRYTPNR